MEEFGYEKMDVYQCSMEFLNLASQLIEGLPKGYSHLADQLRRASLSVPLNIAEGSAQGSQIQRASYFAIARASALECSAVLNCCLSLRLTDEVTLKRGRELVFRVVQMLSVLTRSRRRA